MLILSRSETTRLASLPECIDAVESAFRIHGSGGSLGAARIHLSGIEGGVFHLVAGGFKTGAGTGSVGVKFNGRFPPAEAGGGQRVSGTVLISDAATGKPAALLDSMVVTSLRTAAITAVVCRALGPANATAALLIGAGRQARGQLDALRSATKVSSVAVFDLDPSRAEDVAGHARTLGLEASVVDDVRGAAGTSQIIVTVTPAQAPILRDADVGQGTLVVALGADAPGKQELDPWLVARSRLVVDLVEQAADSGELQHALAAGLMTRDDVHAELAQILVGDRQARAEDGDTIVFDGTGTALQDVAAANVLISAARRQGIGLELDLEL
jgi:alanine dehydrogenase